MGQSQTTFFIVFLLISSHTHVDSTADGFISLGVSQKGLEFAKDLLINSAISSLVPLKLPPIDQHVQIPLLGSVHMVLSGIVIHQVNVSSSIVQPGETGITIVASGATADLNLEWSYSYSNWFFEISDSGLASVQVGGMEIGLTLGLKNRGGTLSVSSEDCGCYVDRISIQLDGGTAWLYQGIVDFFEDDIVSAVEDTITDKTVDGVTEIDSLLQSLPREIVFGDTAALNVTVTDGPVLSNTSILLGLNGLFTDASLARYGASPARYGNRLRSTGQCDGPEKMLEISLHEKVLNSAAIVFFNTNKMHWIIDKIPDQKLLNTAGWRFIIPKLYKEYPNDNMSLNLTISSPPIFDVENQDIVATVNADVTINVLDAGRVIPVVCISMEIKALGFAEISSRVLAGGISLTKLSTSLKWTKIGTLHMVLVQSVMSTLLNKIVVPVVNLRLRAGYPLPHFHGYELQNASILFAHPRITVCGDVAPVYRYIPRHISS